MPKLLNKRAWHNIVLFSLCFVYIVVIGLFAGEGELKGAYNIVISLIYLASFLTIRDETDYTLNIPIALAVLQLLSIFFDLPMLNKISGLMATVFFFVIIIMLVFRIARSKNVTILEFLESVNIYLLLGIAGSVLFSFLYDASKDAFSASSGSFSGMSDFIYFSFITITTLGYGDITPISPLARSVTIMFSITGQLYLTMIIALLIGKYLNASASEN